MLVLNPKDRLTAGQALSHRWVKSSVSKTDPLNDTVAKMKELNARRKLKVSIWTAILGSLLFEHISLCLHSLGYLESDCYIYIQSRISVYWNIIIGTTGAEEDISFKSLFLT